MAFQAEDEPNGLQNTDEYNCLETSHYSQNAIADPVTDINFSSITNIFSDRSEDANGIERNLSISSDCLDEFDDFLKEMDPSLEFTEYDQLPGLMQMLDEINLEQVDRSIEDRQMSVEIQPASDIRRRYETDGKRQIENSRSKPMAIKLPNLKNCKLIINTSFWLQLSLLTTDQNPLNTVYLHSDRLEYHSDDASMGEYGSVRIPLTPKDIQDGIKQLGRISIIKKKLEAYTFQLIPFNLLSANPTVTIYENSIAKSVVAKAKRFRETYNLAFSRIACLLLIKQNDTWRMTDISCQTNIMEEKKSSGNKPSNKRSASSLSDDDDDQDHQASSSKNHKKSPLLIQTLPFTLVQTS